MTQSIGVQMLGLYFHIPFCSSKCPYCDFYSLPLTDELISLYPERLRQELLLRAAEIGRESVETIYFGGGTPSLLPPNAVAMLLATVREHYSLVPNPEITFEVNPGTVDPGRLADYRAAGVNRLSIGAQSFDADQLQMLGRIHDVAAIEEAVSAARSAGFNDLSLDLIYGLPGQTPDDLQRELDALLSFDVDHLSCYTLTVEPDTPFAERQTTGAFVLPDDETVSEAFVTVHDVLEGAGYAHYEISNFARPGKECLHNQRYWKRAESYFGFGAGAHSFDVSGWGRRLENPADLGRYLQMVGNYDDPRVEIETFDRQTALAETLYLGLRTHDGIADGVLRSRFGVTLEDVFYEARLKCGERLKKRDDTWKFDLDGWLLYDHLISYFL